MKIEAQSFSRQVSQFVASQINAMDREALQAAKQDIQKVTPRNQWNCYEFALKKSLLFCIEQRWMSLN